MKLATFTHDGRTRVGVIDGDALIDLSSAAPELPAEMIRLLEAGEPALDRAAAAAATTTQRLPLEQVRLRAPVPRPGKLLAIGHNYLDHVGEMGRQRPEFPVFFTKQSTCVIGPGDPIEIPSVSDQVDYEGELAVVIGRRCRHLAVDDARSVVAGYTIVDDVSVRDWQRRSPTMMIGKSFDSHGPMGPWLVTADEIPDPQDLRLRTWVDGELLQDASTSEMLYGIDEQLATLTAAMTLEPGDVISTGTPAGVGVARTPPRFLRSGDTVEIEIERIGRLSNPVVNEAPA